jgi:hypothetical protein
MYSNIKMKTTTEKKETNQYRIDCIIPFKRKYNCQQTHIYIQVPHDIYTQTNKQINKQTNKKQFNLLIHMYK